MPDHLALALQQRQFPPIIGVSDLSVLIQKAPNSILADRVRAPWRVPPSCEPPGSRQPLWILADVLAWLRQHRRPAAAAPTVDRVPDTTPSPARKRGRPTKAEQIERQRQGGAQ